MAEVACLVMLKNERAVAPCFIGYHAALFGTENIYVFDNGSTDPAVLSLLDRFEAEGGHVERRFTSTDDFHRKGTLLGDLIKRLEQEARYDFFIPLDCDELVVLRTGDGFTADPAAIHAYLDALRDERSILHVTLNLSNLLGEPDRFRAAEYSKTAYPRGVFHHMDHGYHTGVAVGGGSPYRDCDLIYAHFHYRPYDEVVAFAKQKLRVELSDDEIEDHARLRQFRGLGWHMVHYIVDGPEAYYGQFRGAHDPVHFPGLGRRLASLGLAPPFDGFRLPPLAAPAAAPPPTLLIVDEATTARIRGWSLDPQAPDQPVFLRFLVDGSTVWEGACEQSRPDVQAGGHPTDRVGFDFAVPQAALGVGPGRLTVEQRPGVPMQIAIGGASCRQVELAPAPAAAPPAAEPETVIYSHIDSFRRGSVQGWVLRRAATHEGLCLLGSCTVALVHDGRVVAEVLADAVREDVARSMQGEARCGFILEVPRSLLQQNRSAVFRLIVMPERRELAGSPCIATAGFVTTQAQSA